MLESELEEEGGEEEDAEEEEAEPESLIEAGVRECAGEGDLGEEEHQEEEDEGHRGEGEEDAADAYLDSLLVRTSLTSVPKRIKIALKLPKGMLKTRREDFFP